MYYVARLPSLNEERLVGYPGGRGGAFGNVGTVAHGVRGGDSVTLALMERQSIE